MNHVSPFLGEPDSFLQLKHSTLPYWKRGTGPDLIFFHGWPFDSRIWSRIVSRIEDSYTCHLFDLPFAGLSRTSATTPVGLDSYVDAALEVVGHLDLGDRKLGFLGHDSGGSVARLVASTMPERVSGMVFGNTEVPEIYSDLFRRVLNLGRLPGASALLALAVRSSWALSQLRMVGIGPGKRELNRELAETYFGRLRDNPRALDNAMLILKSIDVKDFNQLTEAHRKITAPVRLLWGARDPWFPLEDAQRMLDGFGGEAQLKVVTHGSLMVHEEEPDEFVACIKEIL